MLSALACRVAYGWVVGCASLWGGVILGAGALAYPGCPTSNIACDTVVNNKNSDVYIILYMTVVHSCY